MDEGQSTHCWGPFCVFCIQVTRILSEAELNDWSHVDLLPTDFVLIALPAEQTTFLLKNTSLLVFLEIRSIVLILRQFIVHNPREVCFQYKSSFLFQPYEKCSRIKNYHESMSQKSPLSKRWQERLYMKLEASQLIAEQESNFHFPETTEDNYIMITKTYMGCPHFQFCSWTRSLTTLLTNSRSMPLISLPTPCGGRTKCVYWLRNTRGPRWLFIMNWWHR